MINREVFAKDPLKTTIPNDGVAKLGEPSTDQEWEVLRSELSTFVCKGEYERGLDKMLSSYLANLGKGAQPAAWVSGFYGSGKSHLVRVLEFLWRDVTFPDGATARGLVDLPEGIQAHLRELTTAGRRGGGLWSAAGTLGAGAGDNVRPAILGILLKSAGLPEHYKEGRFVLWLMQNGFYETVRTGVEAAGRNWRSEISNLYVSPYITRSLLEAYPDFASSEAEARQTVKAQYPDRQDISDEELLDTMAEVLALQSGDREDPPCTLLVLDELQQYVGDNADRALRVQNVVEACSARFGGRILFVATGQSALQATPQLGRLRGRFTVQVPLADTDVEQVVREVVLRKAEDKRADLHRVLDENSGEIDRQLSGTEIGPRRTDTEVLVADYPLLPARRRFWERVLRATDRAGSNSQLRAQLRIVHKATREVANEPVGTVVPADILYENLFLDMLSTGVLLREVDNTIRELLEEIPPPAFTSDDGLGWVYQFWQTEAKEEVNASERKISGADLPAHTQLFTDDYIVKFLLHNTLGAWWAARHPDSPINGTLEYLRRLDDGTPAAGDFPGWPQTVAELRVLDPCCGSGHFLTAAAGLLARMRAEEEGLDDTEAFEAVLRDNLFGLELDARCTQLAAFALALQAWKCGGYRELPIPSVACSGLAVGGRAEEWTRLANGDARLEETLRRLHALFRNAPDLGSLIDPSRVAGVSELLAADYKEAETLLEKALKRERVQDDPTAAVFGEAARGLVQTTSLLRGRYHLVATNVPYLARGKQVQVLKDHLEKYHPAGKADLATAFVQRCADYCDRGGTYALVTPQNWLFLSSYKKLRERLLKEHSWEAVSRLGSGAFETISGEVVKVALVVLSRVRPTPEHRMAGIDVAAARTAAEKAELLREGLGQAVLQSSQLRNPDFRITTEQIDQSRLLSKYAQSYNGVQSGDNQRFSRTFWELPSLYEGWVLQQSTVSPSVAYGGREHIFYWQNGRGEFYDFVENRLGKGRVTSWIRGLEAWDKSGIALSVMGHLPATLYQGQLYLDNTTALIPKNTDHLAAIWAFCSSPEFDVAVRKINQKVSVNDGSAIKVPFDLERWQKVADERYPDGLPEPYSNDPTQWLFRGTVADTTEPLQVAVERLLGYSWPDQDADDLEPDPDGIVCLPAVEDELPAAERLRSLLARAYGEQWSPALLDRLLAGADQGGKDLGAWLRDKFFAQHCKLFHNRPLVWHVWDGRKDGFSALVNYHRLDKANLARLIYTYLGDWIEAQAGAAKAGVTGADLRLGAAQNLKNKLEAILHGEPPHDIYVRWKPLHEQPLGWEPDLNDGVRLNIRPFMQAGVLRARPNINWNKDRGKNPDGSERFNDLHLTREEKGDARRKNVSAP